MGNRFGSGYIGTDTLKTSVAQQELIPSPPVNWTVKYSLYKFTFMNDQDCSVLINGNTTAIFLRAGQGFETTDSDAPIYSFKINESGITYNFVGAY
jgi:hypothetical protein